MCTSKVCISVTRRDDHCRIEDRFEHNIYVTLCNGQLFEYCGKKYVNMKTHCGQLEINLPPGCYIIGAVDWAPKDPTSAYLGNNLTHVGIVRVNCEETVCVTLFDPSLHFCGTWFSNAGKLILAGGGAPLAGDVNAALQNAVQAVDRLMAVLPNKDPFVENQVKGIGTRPPKEPTGKTKKGG